MNRVRLRQALIAGWLLFAPLLSACADATPTAPTPLIPSPTPTPPPVPTGGSFQPGPCTFQDWLVMETECGTLTVPEDHQQPNGPQIKLAVAIRKSNAAHPAPDPVLFLQGGPGLSVFTNQPERYMPEFYPLLATRDVILFEQRGVGLSQPALDCPELDPVEAALEEEGLRGSTDLGPALQPALACRDRLTSVGVHLADYTTAQAAADVEALRQALGIRQWNLLGISHGTRLALTVLRDFPAGVRSIILDSPFPPQASVVERPANAAGAFETLFAACAADTACNQAYPDLKQVFYDTADKLNKDPVQRANGANRQIRITGDGFMGAVFGDLIGPAIPYLPQMIYAARDGDFIHLIPFGASDSSPASAALVYSVWCSEQVLPAGLDRLAAADNAYPQLHHLFSGRPLWGLCQQWGVPAAPASEREPVSSTVPSLILSGRFDAPTPPVYAEETARTLPNSYLFTFPGLGHGVSHDTCGMALTAAFVDHPTSKPSAECFARVTGPQWAVPP